MSSTAEPKNGLVASDFPAHAYVHGACNATVSALPPYLPCRRFRGHDGQHMPYSGRNEDT